MTFSLKAHQQDTLGIFSTPGPTQTIKVRLRDWAANGVRESVHHPSQKIVEDKDDSLIVQFELANTTELKRWLLSFGAHAWVLAPKSLADEMAQETKRMAVRYSVARKKSEK